MPLKTLFLNPPSFENFDGGAGSRWPATREIESYWYPVWLCYPAGMLPDSKVVDAPPHGLSIEDTVAMAKDFELLVLELYVQRSGEHHGVFVELGGLSGFAPARGTFHAGDAEHFGPRIDAPNEFLDQFGRFAGGFNPGRHLDESGHETAWARKRGQFGG